MLTTNEIELVRARFAQVALIQDTARHSGYGATATHYNLVGEALLWTLERGLGEGFTPELRSAWANVYGVLAGIMQAGAAEVDECAPPNLSVASLHEAVAA